MSTVCEQSALAFTPGCAQKGAVDTEKAHVEVRAPRLFNGAAVLWINLYGLVLAVPFLVSVAWVSFRPLGPSTFLIPVLFFAGLTYCLPIGLGNLHVRKIVRRINPVERRADDYVVQLILRPRRRSGFWAMMEDADDVGWLRLSEGHLVFEGDSVTLRIPFCEIRSVIQSNVGWRGMFLYGARVAVSVPLPGAGDGFEIADRSSMFLPQSRRIMMDLHRKLAEAVQSADKIGKTV